MKNSNTINMHAINQALRFGELHYFQTIDSTNEYLLNHYKTLESGSICLADCQTAGRGRRGRQWYSPESQNLYFSMLWHYDNTAITQLSSLSLVVSVVIAETFSALNIPHIQIKWPNDIYFHGSKMGGILIESRIDSTGIYLVIGIGLNLGMDNVDETVITQQWADLSDYTFDRTALIIALVDRLQTALQNYPQTGFTHYIKRWQSFDFFAHRPIKLLTADKEIHGISLGINEEGELILQQGEIIQTFAIGEISVRADIKKEEE